MGIVYYGYFPALFLSLKQNKILVWGFLLLGNTALCLSSVSQLGQPSGFLSIFLFTTFLGPALVLFYGIRKNWPVMQIFYACHVPVLFAWAYYLFFPLPIESINIILDPIFETMGDPAKGQVSNLKATRETLTAVFSNLMANFWYLDLSARLIVAGFVLRKIQQSRGLALEMPSVSQLEFEDWTIWPVIGALLGLATSLYVWDGPNEGLYWLSTALLLIISPVFFLRGLGVILTKIRAKKKDKWPAYLKFLLILLIFWAWPHLMLIAVLVGVFDVWFDFKAKPSKPLIKR